MGGGKGKWTQSGGKRTEKKKPTTFYLSPGFHNNGPAVLTTVFDAAKLNQAWTDAVNASNAMAAMAPTQTFGAINSGLTISENSVGTYVFNISSINLNQDHITLSAP